TRDDAIVAKSAPRVPTVSSTGATSARFLTMGWSAARTDVTRIRGGRASAELASHSRRARSAAILFPTTSALGLRRSCGKVSHAGKSMISALGTNDRNEEAK